MAIAFVSAAYLGNNNPGTTNNLSVAFTVGPGSDGLLIVDLEGDVDAGSGGHDDITSVTYNGVALTRASTITNPNVRFLYKYFLLNPASGTNNVVINCTNNHFLLATAAFYTGVRQFGQPDATINNFNASATSLTTSLTTVADNCWISLLCDEDGTVGPPVAGAGTTLRATETGFNTFATFDSNGPLTPPGAHSMTNTTTSGTAGPITQMMVSFAPSIPWGFDEEQHKNARRRPWRAPSQPNVVDGFQFTANRYTIVFDEDRGERVRRPPWRAHPQPDYPGLRPPTVFVPWAFDEEQHFQVRRTAWRARSEVLRNEVAGFQFTANQYTIVFDEDRGERIRRTAWRAPSEDLRDAWLQAPTIFTPWGFDEEQHFQVRRPRPHSIVQPDIIDGFPFTAAQAGIIWVDDTNVLRPQRRLWHPGVQAHEWTLISIPQTLLPPSQAWNWNGQVATLQVKLGTVQKTWVWNPQAGTFSTTLGTVSKSWVWTKNAAPLSLALGTGSKAWLWTKNTPVLSFSLGTVSRAWNWIARPATMNITQAAKAIFNIARAVTWGVVRGVLNRPRIGP